MHGRYHGNPYRHRLHQRYRNTFHIAIRTGNRRQQKNIGVIQHRLHFMARFKPRHLNDIL
ncbi:Uncharacterised protein [Salmonella enterica subsp. enterica serovar Bovismorbificans]|uniref:Uncharacterized protein n=1 Tax=Salmonella enterica subsp. enterica serovar Bovismorbificans TaxID=58097 RepID=A0A655BSI8_SALET|nr:Uncharacterised protein [Salmonella enterica subsp. enterica serovar Bovismorbificans]